MKYIFLDIETTGFAKTSAILEFGAIICDEDLEIVDAINEYYRYYGEIPSSALGVHGLSSQKLEFLSDQDFFEGSSEIHDLLTQPDVILVGHNINSFDLPVIATNLEMCGYSLNLSRIQTIDTLELARKAFKGSHKLEAALQHYLTSGDKTMLDIEELFQSIDILSSKNPSTENKLHNALFDSFCTYCLYTFMMSNGSA